jgi:hypothetical protein
MNDDRRCPGCLQKVTNQNLGGHSGKSALSGILFCETCVQSDLPAIQTAMAPEVRNILNEFARLDRLLRYSSAAVRRLRLEPHIVARQARLVLLAREYVRDCTVLAHRLNRMAMS